VGDDRDDIVSLTVIDLMGGPPTTSAIARDNVSATPGPGQKP
jgi:hypothetical protein